MEQKQPDANVAPANLASNASNNPVEEKLAATSPNVEAEKPALATDPASTAAKKSFTSPNVAQEIPISERRQAYGTAKTENLRDSGLWRIILPGFVILCCLGMLAIPLVILIPLLSNSLSNHITLIWLWIILIILDVGIAAIAVGGLLRIFMTPAGNYRS
jgi:hypothetical protein